MAEEKKEVKAAEPEEKKPEAKPVEKKEAKPEEKKPEAKPVEKKEAKPVEKKEEAKPAAPEASKKRKKKKLKLKAIHTKAKKKSAVARASLKKGEGKFRVNKRDIRLFEPFYLLEFIKEPLDLAGEALVQSVNVDVTVKGGGFMAQAVAIRGAIAKALVEFSKDKKLKEKFIKYDRMLLVDDARFKEAKKPLGLGARRKKQSSKR